MTLGNHFQGRRQLRQPFPMAKLRRLLGIALENAWDVSTRKAYRSHLKSYLEFIRSHNLNLEPTEDTLALYIVYMSNHIKPTSVEVYLTGIIHYLTPFYPLIRIARNSALVKQTLRGCLKLYNTPTRRVRPLSVTELETIASIYTVPNSSHDNLLFVSQLLFGFFGLLRLGELVLPNDHSLDVRRKQCIHKTLCFTANSVSFSLPFHKADRFYKGSEILILSNMTPANPVAVMQRYIQSRDHLFPENPFLWLRENGLPPRRKWFIDKLREHCSSDVGGHSLRAGGATFLAQNNFPLEVIQALGRWSSDTFRIYIRQHPILLQAAMKQNHK